MNKNDDMNGSFKLSDRVNNLEKDFIKLKKNNSSPWQRWIVVLSKLLLPLLLFWLAFTFKDSVQHALEYQRLEVESAEAIEKLLQTLYTKEVSASDSTAAALTLSAYGEAAIMPLIGVLEYGSTNAETASRQALFILGLNHPETVTQNLKTVLSKQNLQFRWQTHQTAIEIIGKINHPVGRDALISYENLFKKNSSEGLKKWKQIVRGANNENYEETHKTLTDALRNYGLNS